MNNISYTAARNNLAKTMEHVCNEHTPVVITRSKQKPVIMMSLEDYKAIKETALLRDPEDVERLIAAIGEIEGIMAKNAIDN